jgi:hypothetical protein
MTKLFLDDIREPWNGTWDVVRNFDRFKAYIEKYGIPEVVAFDHDLGEQHYQAYSKGYNETAYDEGTGYDCAEWMVRHAVASGGKLPSIVIVHSWNTDGAKRIASLFKETGACMVFPYPCTPLKELIARL